MVHFHRRSRSDDLVFLGYDGFRAHKEHREPRHGEFPQRREPRRVKHLLLGQIQFFTWDCKHPQLSWWNFFEKQVPDLESLGFTQVWLPPPHKAGSKVHSTLVLSMALSHDGCRLDRATMLMTSYVAQRSLTAHVLTTYSGTSASLTRKELSRLVGGQRASWYAQSLSQNSVA